MKDDSIGKTLKVALGVCLICSLFVSTAAVKLKARQAENQRLDKVKNILIAGGLYSENANMGAIYSENIEVVVVDLDTGEKIDKTRLEGLDVDNFNVKEVAEDPEYGEDIPSSEDLADIKRRPRYMPVYLVKEGGEATKMILPVYGKGLWSTMYGFLAIKRDLSQVTGITFYDHGETPGLGGEIENPRWTAIWNGKQIYDESGNVKLEVIKGKVTADRPEAKYQVDGLSGATITTRGVDHLVKYWLGENGYGPFLAKVREAS